MPLCYSNNGLSLRPVSPAYQAQAGEVLFPDDCPVTASQLSDAFPDYASAVSSKNMVTQAQIALSDSDTTMLRIAESVSLGAKSWTDTDVVAWVNYRRLLRLLAAGASGAWPTKPAYPTGT